MGFTGSKEGVGADSHKITAIRDWTVPANFRQSRAFFGLCKYYRRFVLRLSDVAAPLHTLMMKGDQFLWMDESQLVIDTPWTMPVGANVLALPMEDGRYSLDCDTSDTGIGAVLSLIQNGEKRPICYGRQLCNRHEKYYNVKRKELLSLITFVKKYRQNLLGRPIAISTDNAAHHCLRRTPEPIGQQERWIKILE